MTNKDEGLLPTVYQIQRSWTGLSWKTCERLQTYIAGILAKALPAREEIEEQERKRIKHTVLASFIDDKGTECVSIPSQALKREKANRGSSIYIIMEADNG